MLAASVLNKVVVAKAMSFRSTVRSSLGRAIIREITAAATSAPRNTNQMRIMNGASGMPNFNAMLTAREKRKTC